MFFDDFILKKKFALRATKRQNDIVLYIHDVKVTPIEFTCTDPVLNYKLLSLIKLKQRQCNSN